MKILNYQYWIQYLIYESKLNDIYLEVSEQKAINIFNKIEEKLKKYDIDLPMKETEKIIKTELDLEVERHIKQTELSSELKIKFKLNEFGNIMYSIEKMDYKVIINIKTYGDKLEYCIIKNNNKFEGEFTIDDFLDDYSPQKINEIINNNENNILVKNSFYNEVVISLYQKLSDIKEGKSKLGIDKEIRYNGIH